MPRFSKTTGRSLLALVAGAGIALSSGCARRAVTTVAQAPQAAPAYSNAMAAPADQPVYVAQPLPTAATAPTTEVPPDALGYETMSNGDQVPVVTYVHTYPEPVASYPRVYWSGRWYYNINGDFVFWSPWYSSWVYYWGPPYALITVWNGYYPWVPFAWGVGFYGPGWYWGGVGVYGYHAYGLSVVHQHHHHHHHYASGGRPSQRPTRDTSKGGPAPGNGRPSPTNDMGRLAPAPGSNGPGAADRPLAPQGSQPRTPPNDFASRPPAPSIPTWGNTPVSPPRDLAGPNPVPPNPGFRGPNGPRSGDFTAPRPPRSGSGSDFKPRSNPQAPPTRVAPPPRPSGPPADFRAPRPRPSAPSNVRPPSPRPSAPSNVRPPSPRPSAPSNVRPSSPRPSAPRSSPPRSAPRYRPRS